MATAAFVLVGYFFFNPFMILLITKYVLFIHEMKYLWLFAIYGYSFTIFIITTILVLLPIDALDWIFLGTSGAISCFFILIEVYHLIRDVLSEGMLKFLIVVAYLIIPHGLFIFSLKYYFLL